MNLTATAALSAGLLAATSAVAGSTPGGAAPARQAPQHWVTDWADMKSRRFGEIHGGSHTIRGLSWDNGLNLTNAYDDAKIVFDTSRCTKVRFGVEVDNFSTSSDETKRAQVIVSGLPKGKAGASAVTLKTVGVGSFTEVNFRPLDISKYRTVTFDLRLNDDWEHSVVPAVGGPEFLCS